MGPAGPAGGTGGSLMGGNYDTLENGLFLLPWDHTTSNTENNEDLLVSSGTASRLVFGTGTTLTQGTATITLRKNGANTALTCTIPIGSSSCMDLVHSVPFANGDRLSFRYTETGKVGPDGARLKFSILYQAP